MPDQPSRSSRQVQIADHLWEAFAIMARDMGVDRDSLINQALFALARQHGYLATSPAIRPSTENASADVLPHLSGIGPSPRPENGVLSGFPAAPAPTGPRPSEPPPRLNGEELYSPPIPKGQTASPMAPPEPSPPPPIVPPEFFAPPASEVHEEESRASAPPVEEPSSLPADAAESGPVLILYADGREVDRVLGPRFLIGRGKHCDLIINSGKVSREHAAIVREGSDFFMEDLGSSNGTWFDKKRITRRLIEDGDEYFVCSEKITCHLG